MSDQACSMCACGHLQSGHLGTHGGCSFPNCRCGHFVASFTVSKPITIPEHRGSPAPPILDVYTPQERSIAKWLQSSDGGVLAMVREQIEKSGLKDFLESVRPYFSVRSHLRSRDVLDDIDKALGVLEPMVASAELEAVVQDAVARGKGVLAFSLWECFERCEKREAWVQGYGLYIGANDALRLSSVKFTVDTVITDHFTGDKIHHPIEQAFQDLHQTLTPEQDREALERLKKVAPEFFGNRG